MKEHQTSHKVFARSTENRHGRFKDFPSKKSNKAHYNSSKFISHSFFFRFLHLYSIFRVPFILFRQITDKSLNAAFASLSEDSVDLSPISEISFANHNEDVTVSSNLTILFLPMLFVTFLCHQFMSHVR